MLAGGYFRGSSTLFSGAPGTAKTTLGMHFLSSMCTRGEKALFVGFDESSGEAIRNMRSIGIDLAPHVQSGRLRMHRVINRAAGPDEVSYEITSLIEREQPQNLLIDPISIFSTSLRSQNAVYRIIQLCKRRGITVILTSLLDTGVGELEATRSHISALCDNWIHLSYVVSGGERNRALTIIKARGTPHSNQVAELVLGAGGISVADAYTEDGAVLMGSLRWQRERANQEATHEAQEIAAGHFREAERAADEIARQIAGLTGDLEDKRREMESLRRKASNIQHAEDERRSAMARRRGSALAASAKA
jgi:circadian clock protein KaiC